MSNVVDWLVDHEPNFSKSRLPSLYADLVQQKSANPDGFVVNATAWQAALTRAALAGQLPTEQKIILRTSDQLLDALRSPQYGQPTGLGLVLDDALHNGKVLDLQDFNAAQQSIYQKSWLPSPWTVIRWSLRHAGLVSNGSYDQSGRLKKGDLVLVEALEKLSKQILAQGISRQETLTDRVMSRAAFAQLVAGTDVGALTVSEIEVLLKYLSRDRAILSYDSQTVKLKPPSAEHPEAISEEDATIASIKDLINSLEEQVSILEIRAAAQQEKARSAVAAKNNAAALSALRSKKLAEANLQKRRDMLQQVDTVFSSIEQASGQAQFLQVMQSSAQTLRTLNQRVGGVEKIDTVMDDLREQMGHVSEVGQVLQEPLDGTTFVDEAEIDDELEALRKDEILKKEALDDTVTKSKLAELERAEQKIKEKAGEVQTKPQDNTLDKELESFSHKLAQIRLEDGVNGESADQAKEREQLAAT